MASKKKKRPNPPPPPVRTKPPRAATAPTGPTPKQQERSSRRVSERRDALRRRLGTVGLIAAVLAAVALYVFLDRRGDEQLRQALEVGTCQADDDADPTRVAGQNHVPNPTFAVNPPAGGNHLGSASRAGVYDGTAVPADGLLVHSLEHGYVVLWHQPDLPAEQKKQLEDFQTKNDEDVIVAEKADLPTPFAVTAWEKRLLCDEVEAAPLQRFFDEHVGNAPEDVGRG